MTGHTRRRYFVVFLLAVVALPLALAQNDNTIVGKWAFVLETSGGDRNIDAEFELDGTQVKGKWGEAPVKGTFTDGKLELNFPFNSSEAGAGEIKISGALENGSLKGTWAFQEYNGTFTAKRPG